jgi:hypothetical protein
VLGPGCKISLSGLGVKRREGPILAAQTWIAVPTERNETEASKTGRQDDASENCLT